MSKWWPRTRARGANLASDSPHFGKVETGTLDPPAEGSSRQVAEGLAGAVQKKEQATLFSADVEALIREPGEYLGFKDQSLEQGLGKEAQDAEGYLPEDALLTTEKDSPPTPEMELAFTEEAMVAEEPPEPVEEQPILTVSGTAADQPWLGEMVMVGSPSPETGDIIRGVLPPRPLRMVTGLAEDAPVTTNPPHSATPTLSTDALEWGWPSGEDRNSPATGGRQRLGELNQQIDSLHDRALKEIGTSRRVSKWCYQELRRARDLLQRHELAGIPQAEYHLQQVQAHLKQVEESRVGAKKYGWRIAGWGLLWGTVLVTVLGMLRWGWFDSYLAFAGSGQAAGVTTGQAAIKLGILLQALLWGGIGGAVAIWFHLLVHVSRRDFDPQYNLSYFGTAFFGLVVGGMVYMAAQLLNLSLGILSVLPPGSQGPGVAPFIPPWVVYLLAGICGFKARRLLDLMDRAAKCVFSEHAPRADDLQNPPPMV